MSKESNPADGENWAQRTGRGRAVGKGSAPGRAEHGAGAPGASGGRPGAVCALLTPHHATARRKCSHDLKVTPLPGTRAGSSRDAGWGQRGLPPGRPARASLQQGPKTLGFGRWRGGCAA